MFCLAAVESQQSYCKTIVACCYKWCFNELTADAADLVTVCIHEEHRLQAVKHIPLPPVQWRRLCPWALADYCDRSTQHYQPTNPEAKNQSRTKLLPFWSSCALLQLFSAQGLPDVPLLLNVWDKERYGLWAVQLGESTSSRYADIAWISFSLQSHLLSLDVRSQRKQVCMWLYICVSIPQYHYQHKQLLHYVLSNYQIKKIQIFAMIKIPETFKYSVFLHQL